MSKLFNYVSLDKNFFCGDTANEVVEAMRAESLDGKRLDLNAFMRRTAATAYTWAKRPIRSDNATEFLADLCDAGILTLEGLERPSVSKGEQA